MSDGFDIPFSADLSKLNAAFGQVSRMQDTVQRRNRQLSNDFIQPPAHRQSTGGSSNRQQEHLQGLSPVAPPTPRLANALDDYLKPKSPQAQPQAAPKTPRLSDALNDYLKPKQQAAPSVMPPQPRLADALNDYLPKKQQGTPQVAGIAGGAQTLTLSTATIQTATIQNATIQNQKGSAGSATTQRQSGQFNPDKIQRVKVPIDSGPMQRLQAAELALRNARAGGDPKRIFDASHRYLQAQNSVQRAQKQMAPQGSPFGRLAHDLISSSRVGVKIGGVEMMPLVSRIEKLFQGGKQGGGLPKMPGLGQAGGSAPGSGGLPPLGDAAGIAGEGAAGAEGGMALAGGPVGLAVGAIVLAGTALVGAFKSIAGAVSEAAGRLNEIGKAQDVSGGSVAEQSKLNAAGALIHESPGETSQKARAFASRIASGGTPAAFASAHGINYWDPTGGAYGDPDVAGKYLQHINVVRSFAHTAAGDKQAQQYARATGDDDVLQYRKYSDSTWKGAGLDAAVGQAVGGKDSLQQGADFTAAQGRATTTLDNLRTAVFEPLIPVGVKMLNEFANTIDTFSLLATHVDELGNIIKLNLRTWLPKWAGGITQQEAEAQAKAAAPKTVLDLGKASRAAGMALGSAAGDSDDGAPPSLPPRQLDGPQRSGILGSDGLQRALQDNSNSVDNLKATMEKARTFHGGGDRARGAVPSAWRGYELDPRATAQAVSLGAFAL